MLKFNSIFFDSQPLLAAQWPNVSTALNNIFIFARMFEVRLFLPIAVEMELEANRLRKFETNCSDVTSTMDKLKNSLWYTDTGEVTIRLPNREAVLGQYRAKVQDVKDAWDIETIPLAERSLEELFVMAIHREPPFKEVKEEVAGFQDTVIFLSVVDYLRKEQEWRGAFVSNDGIYDVQKKRLLHLAESAGMRLSLYRTLDEIGAEFETELMSRIDEQVREMWAQDERNATEALRRRADEIQEFIATNIEFSDSFMMPVGKIIKIDQVEVTNIQNVRTIYPGQRGNEESAKLSFEASIRMQVVMDTAAYTFFRYAFRSLKVGEESSPTLPDLPAGPVLETRELEITIEVEALGTIKDGQYTDVQFLSARMK